MIRDHSLARPLARQAAVLAPSGSPLRALVSTAREMWSQPALRHLLVGGALASTTALGVLNWLPTFLARSHGLSAAPTGVALALIVGVGGGPIT